jgi:arylsulfatase A-like enzyme
VLGDRAVDFVRQKSDKPFFLYLSFTAPHAPLEAPEEYLKKFQHLAVDGEPGVFCAYTKKMIPHPRQVYAAMVSTLDDTIGSVLQALRDSGQERNTLIYFLSDNGGPTVYSAASNGPFRGEKGDLLEGGIRVPFAVQWKGTIPEGKTIDTPVYSLDLLPTSLAAAGMPVAKQLEGVDLLPLLIKGEPLNARQLYWNFPFPPQFPLWGIRDGEWKLVKEIIYNPDPNRGRLSTGKTRIGLYRITDDLQEEHDLSEQYPEVRQRLQSEYDAWASTLPPEPGK